jgi:hypothetical protein
LDPDVDCYLGNAGGVVFALCPGCAQRIADLTAIDPQLPELVALRARIVLAASPPRGHA